MADKKKEEDKEEKKEGEGGEEGAPKKSKKKLIIIIVVAVVLLAGIGAGLFFALGSKKAEEGAGDGQAEQAADEGGDTADESADAADEEEASGGEEESGGTILPLDTIIVNLQVKGSFLKVTLHLQFKEVIPQEEAEPKVPIIRNAIIRLLSSKSAADILTPEGKEQLADEIVEAVNEAFGKVMVTKVYFTEFIVQ